LFAMPFPILLPISFWLGEVVGRFCHFPSDKKSSHRQMNGRTRVARWFVFKPKYLDLGKFSRALDWNMLIYVMAIWTILRTFEQFYDHLVHFVLIWYIFSGFGITYQQKSGNPAPHFGFNLKKNGNFKIRILWKF
jgi:hypothetical protein